MTAPPPFSASDARWLAHRYALVDDRIHFRFVEREVHAAVPFLTEDNIGARPAATAPRAEAVADAGPPAPVHFIFHSAFCASTLLCRALDLPGLAMGLSEPVILNDLVGIRRRQEASPQQLGALTDQALRLLGRGWQTGEAVVIKPSNILNPLAAGMLLLRPASKAVLLSAPLEMFLSSVARKGMWCRLWVRELLEGFLIDGVVDLGFEAKDYLRLTDLQVAAVGWVAQQALFAALASRFGDRVIALDSEELTGAPLQAIPAVARHFGLPWQEGHDASLAQSPALRRHSKFGTDFSAEDRRREQAEAASAHGEEISQVAEWGKAVAATAGVPLHLPHRIAVAAD